MAFDSEFDLRIQLTQLAEHGQVPPRDFLVFSRRIDHVVEKVEHLLAGRRKLGHPVLFMELMTNVCPADPLTVVPYALGRVGKMASCPCTTHSVPQSIPGMLIEGQHCTKNESLTGRDSRVQSVARTSMASGTNNYLVTK
jgi:hypothetical protein